MYSHYLCDLSGKVRCKYGHPHTTQEKVDRCEKFPDVHLIRGMIDAEEYLDDRERLEAEGFRSKYWYMQEFREERGDYQGA